jgi:hypothetical protein
MFPARRMTADKGLRPAKLPILRGAGANIPDERRHRRIRR